MSHILRSVGAVTLTVALCLGMSAGPASGDQPPPSPTAIATEPSTTDQTATPVPATTTVEPTTSATPDQSATPVPATSGPAPTSETPAGTASPSQAPATDSTPATPPENMPDLKLTVWFDKPAYFSYEQITAHAKVTNVGTAAMDEVVVRSTGNLSNQLWAPMDWSGVRIEPGQTVEGSTTGNIWAAEDVLTLVVTAGTLGNAQDANPADNTVTVTVPITLVYGSYRGTVYGDRNGDHTMDPGEQLSGVRVQIMRSDLYLVQVTTTNAAGRFEFPRLLAGAYSVWLAADGWHLPSSEVEVDGVDDPDVLVRAVATVTDTLSVSAAFTESSYRVNDVAHMHVTLTNRGTVGLVDLTASWIVSDWTATIDAGELAGSGLTLAPGETRTVDMTVTITKTSAAWGYLYVLCTIGAPPDINGWVRAAATARVPGGVVPSVSGRLQLFRHKPQLGPPTGDPLPDVKVYLRNQVTGAVVARAVTDVGGAFTFYDLPADLYDVGVVGPWQFVYTSTDFSALGDGYGNSWGEHLLTVIPGPYQPDPDAQPTPAQPTPVPPATTVEPAETAAGLASTGANVTWLALGAMMALIVGAGLVVATSRNR